VTRPNPDADPRILPLRAVDGSLAAVVAAALAAAARPGVRVACDVDPRLHADADPAAIRGLLEPLLRAACAAALEADPDSDGPALGEVLVTAVDTGDGIEIEVADSGPARRPESTAELRRLLAVVEGSLTVVACAEGGTAVTLRLPQRRARGLAA
jgi:hypothetical protein